MAPATSEGTCTVEYQGNRNRCLVSSLGSSCRLQPTRTPDLPVACFCHSPGPPRRRGSIVPCVRGLRRLRPGTLPVAIVRKKPHDRPAQALTVLLLLCNVVAGIGFRVTDSVIRAVRVHSTSVQGGGWPCLAQCVTHMPEGPCPSEAGAIYSVRSTSLQEAPKLPLMKTIRHAKWRTKENVTRAGLRSMKSHRKGTSAIRLRH